ncbi:MAG: glycosyltransferase family 39 protein [Ktedonobacteraceae bacterium]
MHDAVEEKDTPINGARATPVSLWRHKLSAIGHFFTVYYWILCILIGGIALGLNFYRLGMQSLWFDEILSVERARQPLSVLLQIIFATQPNMAFYYIFMHYWLAFTALLGWHPTEIVVRSPSAVFAAASAVMIFLLGRRFLGMIAGLVAAALYVLNDLQLVYAQDTRSYALQLLLICFAWYALFTIMTTQSRQKHWWVCFGIAMLVAIYSQLFSFLILAAQATAFSGLCLLPSPWRTNVRQQFRNALITLVSILVLAVPLIYASRHGSKTGWLPIPHPIDLYLLFLTICANSRIYLYLLLAMIVLGLFVAAIAYRSWGKHLLNRISLVNRIQDEHVGRLQQLLPIGFALVCWLIVPLVLSYIISQGPIRLFSSRYLVTIVPPFMLLVGLGIAVLSGGTSPNPRVPARGTPRGYPGAGSMGGTVEGTVEGTGKAMGSTLYPILQASLTIALLLLTLHYVPLYYQQTQVEDWNVTTFWLEHQYQANDGLVCFDNSQGCQLGIEYYLTAYPSAAHFTADSPGSFPWVQYDLTNHQGNTQLAVDPRALADFGAHHPRIFFITGRLSTSTTVAQANTAQHWLDTHYRFITQIVTKSVAIRLYATR